MKNNIRVRVYNNGRYADISFFEIFLCLLFFFCIGGLVFGLIVHYEDAVTMSHICETLLEEQMNDLAFTKFVVGNYDV